VLLLLLLFSRLGDVLASHISEYYVHSYVHWPESLRRISAIRQRSRLPWPVDFAQKVCNLVHLNKISCSALKRQQSIVIPGQKIPTRLNNFIPGHKISYPGTKFLTLVQNCLPLYKISFLGTKFTTWVQNFIPRYKISYLSTTFPTWVQISYLGTKFHTQEQNLTWVKNDLSGTLFVQIRPTSHFLSKIFLPFCRFFCGRCAGVRVTWWVFEKNAQNLAQPIFDKINRKPQLRKKQLKYLDYSSDFLKKTAQSKPSPNSRKFAESGHPVRSKVVSGCEKLLRCFPGARRAGKSRQLVNFASRKFTQTVDFAQSSGLDRFYMDILIFHGWSTQCFAANCPSDLCF
jgi:hypothetical protein